MTGKRLIALGFWADGTRRTSP